MQWPQWAVAAVQIPRVVEDDHLRFAAGASADVFEDGLPVLGCMVRRLRTRGDREDIEVAVAGGDLVADDRREILQQAEPAGLRHVVDMLVVVGGDGKLDAFPGDGDHALGHVAVTMP